MALTPVVLAISNSGLTTARRVANAIGAELHGRAGRVEGADLLFDNALDHARDLFAAGRPIIGICAAGILIRAVAPLLNDKTSEPPVLAVPDDGSTVIPLLGGHRGANRLAKEIAMALESVAAVTTAGDVSLGLALDEPPAGWRLSNPEHAKSVMASMLAEGAQTEGELPFEIKESKGALVKLVGSEEPVKGDAKTLVYHPQNFALGVGAARNCDPQELDDLVARALHDANIAQGAIAAIGTLDLKADEPAMIALSERLGVPLRLFSAAELETQAPRLKTPSEVVFSEVGCHGVAEGAALSLGGSASELIIAKQKTTNATMALARAPGPITDITGRPRGRLSLIGIGPGQSAWRTPEASKLVNEADLLVGYGLYIDLLGAVAKGKERVDFPLGGEEDRCRYALEEAGKGRRVALICSGDSGIYAMGALVFELLDRTGETGVSDAAKRAEVISTPGISALQGAAARAGAPLGHDFCAISLSDLLTRREDILKRLRAAAKGDFVIAFYNPVSKRRRDLLAKARDILLEHRPADCPVLLARSLGRPDESLTYRRLDGLEVDEVDMMTVVLVGSSNTKLVELGEGPRMYTPRGYARKIDGDLS